MKKKKNIIMLVILAIVVLIAFRNIKGRFFSKNLSESEKDLGIPIELITVDQSDMLEEISYIGTVKSEKSAVVSPSIGGQILNIYVQEGDMIKSGELLAKIDDSQLNASYITAEKKLQTLRTNYNYLNSEIGKYYSTNPLVKKQNTLKSNYEFIREESEKYKKLYEGGAIAKIDYDRIKQEADTVHLQLEELKATTDDAYNKLVHERDMVGSQIEELSSSIDEMGIKIEETMIKAPIDGMVKKIHYDAGNFAAMGMPFANIDNNDELIVEVKITESDLEKINVGDQVALKVTGLNDEINSMVIKIIPNINPETRVGVIEIGPIKSEEGISLVSGNSAEARIIINEVKNRLVIPKNAIKTLNDESIVYLYEDGKVRERKVTTGLTVGENVEIVEGLLKGDEIATENLSKLYEDAKVYIFKGVDK